MAWWIVNGSYPPYAVIIADPANGRKSILSGRSPQVSRWG